MTNLTLAYFEKKFPDSAVIAYDGECPMCTNYARLVRLRATIPSVVLYNLRDLPPTERAAITNDYDLDEGMLFIWSGQVFHGSNAVNQIALLSSTSGAFNTANRIIFKHRLFTKAVYPILRFGRLMLLKLLRRHTFADDNN